MGITSEVGRLREVVVHRPGLELRRLTPANKERLLFDELVWVGKAQQEHDGFAALLREQGVTVHLLDELLVEALADDDVRAGLLAQLVTPWTCGVELVDRVADHVRSLTGPDLVRHLVGGLTVAEVPGAEDGFVGELLGPQAFLLPPLPNAVFTRDPSMWIGDGVVLARMQAPARQAERALWEVVYRAHPRLRDAVGGFWNDPAPSVVPAGLSTLEGGDVLVLSEHCVALGLSERTTPVAVENLAAALFAGGQVREVLAVDLPKGRQTMHLDTVLTVVDRDAVLLWPRAQRVTRAYRITPGTGVGTSGAATGRMHVREEPDLLRGLARGLGADQLRVITTGDDELAADREQWDDGNNTLALQPGVVVAYERNVDTNARLEAAGIRVHRISSFELPRGRGGPRCMACPLSRDPV